MSTRPCFATALRREYYLQLFVMRETTGREIPEKSTEMSADGISDLNFRAKIQAAAQAANMTVVQNSQLSDLQSDAAQYRLPEYVNDAEEMDRQVMRYCYQPTDANTIQWCGSTLARRAQLNCPPGDCTCLNRATLPSTPNLPASVMTAFRQALSKLCAPTTKNESFYGYSGLSLCKVVLIALCVWAVLRVAKKRQ
jgi:hypothetical protein